MTGPITGEPLFGAFSLAELIVMGEVVIFEERQQFTEYMLGRLPEE